MVVPIYETTNIDHTGTGGDYKQGVFHRDALALAMMQDLKIETQRDASLRADEIVATAVYGVGELNDTYGVEVHQIHQSNNNWILCEKLPSYLKGEIMNID